MPVKSAAWTLPLLLPCKPGGSFSITQRSPPSVVPSKTFWPAPVSSPIAWQTDLVGHAIPLISVTPVGSISPVHRFPPSVVRSATAASPPATQIEVDGQARASTLPSPQNQAASFQEPAPVPAGAARALGWENSPSVPTNAKVASVSGAERRTRRRRRGARWAAPVAVCWILGAVRCQGTLIPPKLSVRHQGSNQNLRIRTRPRAATILLRLRRELSQPAQSGSVTGVRTD